MNSDPIDRRDYGILEQKVTQLTTDVHALKETVEAMRDMMQQAQGGWRLLLAVGGAAATIATAVQWGLSHLSMK